MASPVLSPGHLPTTSGRRETDSTGGHHTKFQASGGVKHDDYRQQRNKILTVKYGKQQMILIRKRVSVEMWLMENLEELYEGNSEAYLNDFDIDELLDLGSDQLRHDALRDRLTDCPADSVKIEEFITQFIGKMKLL